MTTRDVPLTAIHRVVQGRDVETVDDGAPGPLSVLLHGFTNRPSLWRDVVRLMHATGPMRTAAIGLFGHGPGGASHPRPARFDDEADTIAEIIRALGPESEPVVLVGYSLGARVALRVALRHPQRITRLVLVSGTPGLEDDAERDARRRTDRRWVDVLRSEGLAVFTEAWSAQPLLVPHRPVDVARLDAHRAMRLDHDAEGLARAMEVLGLAEMPDSWPELAQLACEVVLVVGEHDAKFRATSARMHARLPSARLAVIPGSGHDVVLEAPEALAPLIVDPSAPHP